MKILIKSDSEKKLFIDTCKELDRNLGSLSKENIFFLMKSEVIKNTLEYKHSKVRSFDITTSLISNLEEDLEKKQSALTPFSLWIWRSVIAELKLRESIGLISAKSFNVSNFNSEKRIQAQRFSKYLNYLIPWIDKMDNLNAENFNNLSKEVSWLILKRLNQRSILFQQIASTASTGIKYSIFNIPQNILQNLETDSEIPNEKSSRSLQEVSQKERFQAEQQIQNISADDLSPLSDELSKELEQKAP